MQAVFTHEEYDKRMFEWLESNKVHNELEQAHGFNQEELVKALTNMFFERTPMPFKPEHVVVTMASIMASLECALEQKFCNDLIEIHSRLLNAYIGASAAIVERIRS